MAAFEEWIKAIIILTKDDPHGMLSSGERKLLKIQCPKKWGSWLATQ